MLSDIVFIIGLIVVLALWNWLAGILATLVPLGPFVWRALKKLEANPDDATSVRRYLRWVAANHLFNHIVTVAGSFAICAWDQEVPAWEAWTVFAIYFVFTRLGHIIDAATRLVKADSTPLAADL